MLLHASAANGKRTAYSNGNADIKDDPFHKIFKSKTDVGCWCSSSAYNWYGWSKTTSDQRGSAITTSEQCSKYNEYASNSSRSWYQRKSCQWGDKPTLSPFEKIFFGGEDGMKTKTNLPATCTEERWYKEGICQVPMCAFAVGTMWHICSLVLQADMGRAPPM